MSKKWNGTKAVFTQREMKNGLIVNGKYESTLYILKHIHL